MGGETCSSSKGWIPILDEMWDWGGAGDAELRPCVWDRDPQPGLHQHPHLTHVTVGRNQCSINTLAASQLGVQPPTPSPELRGGVRHSRLLLPPCLLPWSCFKSWGDLGYAGIMSPCPAPESAR